MSTNMAGFYVSGTAALKVDSIDRNPAKPPFTAFECSRSGRSGQSHYGKARDERACSRRTLTLDIKEYVRSVLERSEMACSLLREDVRGVPYHAFSKANATTLSVATSVIAIVSIALGA